jgi:hypothetical protein
MDGRKLRRPDFADDITGDDRASDDLDRNQRADEADFGGNRLRVVTRAIITRMHCELDAGLSRQGIDVAAGVAKANDKERNETHQRHKRTPADRLKLAQSKSH